MTYTLANGEDCAEMTQNVVCGTSSGSTANLRLIKSKHVSSYFSTYTYVVGTQKDGYFDGPKQMLKRTDKKIFIILHLQLGDFLPIPNRK